MRQYCGITTGITPFFKVASKPNADKILHLLGKKDYQDSLFHSYDLAMFLTELKQNILDSGDTIKPYDELARILDMANDLLDIDYETLSVKEIETSIDVDRE